MTLRIRTFIKCAVVLCARGEQQLLAFARAVQSDGRVLCLEESSSALGVTIEARVNKIVYATAVTAVRVGVRMALWRHHDTPLRLLWGGVDGGARVAAWLALVSLMGKS